MKISIITVCFNSEATIVDTINSVNSQSYKNIEHIFVDGGSKDKTLSRVHIPNHADDIIAVTDKQYILAKLKYPDIQTLGFYSFPLDYFK